MRIPILILIALLLTPLATTTEFDSDFTWSDDFEDEDFDDWTIQSGSFTIKNGTLRTERHFINEVYIFGGEVTHPSTGCIGSWNFEIMARNFKVWFIASSSLSSNTSGYYIHGVNEGNGLSIRLRWVENNTLDKLGYYRFQSDDYRINIKIERDARGLFRVLVDDVLAFEVLDERDVTSNYFIFDIFGEEAWIDNIDVNTFSPLNTSTHPFILGGLSLFISALFLVEYKEHRIEMVKQQ